MTEPTITFELELTLDGDSLKGSPGSHDEPAYGPTVENIEIVGLGYVEFVPRSGALNYNWRTVSLLDGVDLKSPAIQKLLENMIAAKRQEAEDALLSA